MKVNFKKLKNKNLYICTSGNKPGNTEELKKMLQTCCHWIKKAQAEREKNSTGERWAADAIEEFIDCIE